MYEVKFHELSLIWKPLNMIYHDSDFGLRADRPETTRHILFNFEKLITGQVSK